MANMEMTVVRSRDEYFAAVKPKYCIGVFVEDVTDYDTDCDKEVIRYAVYIHLTNGKLFYGGEYTTKEKADIVAKEFMAYISGRSSLKGDFWFPEDKNVVVEEEV